MATHDYVIDNSTGANVRTDLNNVLQAILTNNSSGSAPSTTAAYMLWADTGNNLLKMRNSANDGWIDLRTLTGGLTTSADATINSVNVGKGTNSVSNNTVLGALALIGSVSGDNNTAIGRGTLRNLTSGAFNTALGANALLSHTTGQQNTACGYAALEQQTTASLNTAMGFAALRNSQQITIQQ